MVAGHSKKMRIRFGLAITKRPDPHWRPNEGLLKEPQQIPVQIKGWPQFHAEWDLHQKGATNRLAFESKVDVPKRQPDEYWTFENCHEMMGKFRFLMQVELSSRLLARNFGVGVTPVDLLEKEIFQAAQNLNLVGWFKARKNFAQGHLQGDVFGLAQMKRWFLEHHLDKNVGTVRSAEITDENFAIPEPLEYKHLISVKDWRTVTKKVQHRDADLETKRLRTLETQSRVKWQERREKAFESERLLFGS
ncbi:unnamed protein product [Amoebophrya sp. A120]|nr:unnamed protein product [Amoebophrya sp. A120]|eukprot:GSA120T00005706001.1